ncbi:MAG: RNA 2',3'-cyclic phosphodiesterase [Planctomycetota bacterium]
MRCFIALDIEDHIKQQLVRLQEELWSKPDIKKSDAKWVDPEITHLTLKFLGEVKDEKIPQICELLKSVSGKHAPFDIEIAKTGCFGGSSARVLWAGAGENCLQLLQLQQDIDSALEQADFSPENRQFAGHLTLARIKNPIAGKKIAQLVQQYTDISIGTNYVESICLYQSQLTPKGPVYTLLARFTLNG